MVTALSHWNMIRTHCCIRSIQGIQQIKMQFVTNAVSSLHYFYQIYQWLQISSYKPTNSTCGQVVYLNLHVYFENFCLSWVRDNISLLYKMTSSWTMNGISEGQMKSYYHRNRWPEISITSCWLLTFSHLWSYSRGFSDFHQNQSDIQMK